ncbi:hypothetical protein ACP70R_000170 [Stipagrostis hirtigluma subsp. patula]
MGNGGGGRDGGGAGARSRALERARGRRQPVEAGGAREEGKAAGRGDGGTGTCRRSVLPLHGRLALVTGRSWGTGREVSSHLAALGASVVVNYASNSAKADELVAELASRGRRVVAVRADVSDPDAVRALFDRTEEAFGSPPQIEVACALQSSL